MTSSSPSLVSRAAKWRETTVTRCPREWKGGGNAQAPQGGHPLEPPGPIARPTATLGDGSPHGSPALLQAHPAVRGCLIQVGPGKHRRWLGDGHRELPAAIPETPPSTRRSLAPPCRPRRHARQEARHEPDWPRLCRRPKISGEGCEVTAHHWLMSQCAAR